MITSVLKGIEVKNLIICPQTALGITEVTKYKCFRLRVFSMLCNVKDCSVKSIVFLMKGVLVLRKLSFLQTWLGQESRRPGAKDRSARDIFACLLPELP